MLSPPRERLVSDSKISYFNSKQPININQITFLQRERSFSDSNISYSNSITSKKDNKQFTLLHSNRNGNNTTILSNNPNQTRESDTNSTNLNNRVEKNKQKT